MDQEIKRAISNKSLIEFVYNGHPRVVEPHVLGASDGISQLLGYQIGGSSNTGGIPEWRRFTLSRMSGFRVRQDGYLGPRPLPSGKHSSWDYVFAVVSN